MNLERKHTYPFFHGVSSVNLALSSSVEFADEAQKAETVLSAVRYSSLALQSFCFHVQIEHSTGMSHCR